MTQTELLNYNIQHVKNSIPGIDKKAGASKKELAFFLGKSTRTIERWIEDGTSLPEYIQDREKKHILFPLINIALYLTNHTVKVS